MKRGGQNKKKKKIPGSFEQRIRFRQRPTVSDRASEGNEQSSNTAYYYCIIRNHGWFKVSTHICMTWRDILRDQGNLVFLLERTQVLVSLVLLDSGRRIITRACTGNIKPDTVKRTTTGNSQVPQCPSPNAWLQMQGFHVRSQRFSLLP